MNEQGRIQRRVDAFKPRSEKMAKTMHEYGSGELHSGSKEGPTVTNRKQAIAIGLKQSGQSREGVQEGDVSGEARDDMGRWTAGQHAEHLRKMGDTAISEIKAEEAKHPRHRPDKAGKAIAPIAQKHMAAHEEHFAKLAGHVKTAKHAKEIAKEYGLSANYGDKEGTLKAIKNKAIGRIGAMVRPYA